MRAPLVALWLAALAMPAAGEPRREEPPRRDLCAAGAPHRGTAIDLDVKGAGLQDVLRLIADAGHASVVIPDDVTGQVTLRLARTPWDAVACAVARLHHLTITVDGSILLVTRALPRPGDPGRQNARVRSTPAPPEPT
jgi:hypothetical protein